MICFLDVSIFFGILFVLVVLVIFCFIFLVVFLYVGKLISCFSCVGCFFGVIVLFSLMYFKILIFEWFIFIGLIFGMWWSVLRFIGLCLVILIKLCFFNIKLRVRFLCFVFLWCYLVSLCNIVKLCGCNC